MINNYSLNTFFLFHILLNQYQSIYLKGQRKVNWPFGEIGQWNLNSNPNDFTFLMINIFFCLILRLKGEWKRYLWHFFQCLWKELLKNNFRFCNFIHKKWFNTSSSQLKIMIYGRCSTVYGDRARIESNSSARKRHLVSLPMVARVSFHSRHLQVE